MNPEMVRVDVVFAVQLSFERLIVPLAQLLVFTAPVVLPSHFDGRW